MESSFPYRLCRLPYINLWGAGSVAGWGNNGEEKGRLAIKSYKISSCWPQCSRWFGPSRCSLSGANNAQSIFEVSFLITQDNYRSFLKFICVEGVFAYSSSDLNAVDKPWYELMRFAKAQVPVLELEVHFLRQGGNSTGLSHQIGAMHVLKESLVIQGYRENAILERCRHMPVLNDIILTPLRETIVGHGRNWTMRDSIDKTSRVLIHIFSSMLVIFSLRATKPWKFSITARVMIASSAWVHLGTIYWTVSYYSAVLKVDIHMHPNSR